VLFYHPFSKFGLLTEYFETQEKSKVALMTFEASHRMQKWMNFSPFLEYHRMFCSGPGFDCYSWRMFSVRIIWIKVGMRMSFSAISKGFTKST
jgi:hypothetical protein